MAKQTKTPLHQTLRIYSKLDKYCMNLFGINLEEKLCQCQQEFVNKCWEQIKEAEKVTGQDYLEIKE